ncbi:hypothetical protein [Thermoflexus sp.]|nr:hypothetical protein [Thermoflexus sp.]
MRSFPALMLLLLVEYAIYALFLRPIVGGIAEILQAVASMMHTISFR